MNGSTVSCPRFFEMVEIFETQDNDAYGYDITKKHLQQHTDINCIYIVAAGVAGVCRAVKESPDDILIISFDDIAATRALLTEGTIAFTICQEPFQQGYKAIQLLFNYFMENKAHAPADYFTETVIKIAENV